MKPITREQRESIHNAYVRYLNDMKINRVSKLYPINSESYLTFRRRFFSTSFDDCIVGYVPAGYYLGIEADGHSHT